MNVHKILIGDGAEVYVPYAMRRVKYLAGRFDHHVVQNGVVEDFHISVAVNVTPGFHRITITNTSSLGYEFHTTEDVTWNTTQWNIVGSVTNANVTKANPVSTGVAAFNTPDFRAAHPNMRIMPALVPLKLQDPKCQTRWGFNMQRLHEYTTYIGPKGASGFCTSTYISADHHHEFWVDTGYQQLGIAPLSDIMTDIPLTYHPPGLEPFCKHPNAVDFNGAIWATNPDPWTVRIPGRGTVQVVNDPVYGTETYFILTDSRNDFYIYPMSAAPADVQYNVGTAYEYVAHWKTDNYIKITPPFPSWAQGATASGQFNSLGYVNYKTSSTFYFNGLDTNPKTYNRFRYKWNFNSTGTRVCAIVSTVEVDNTNPNALHYDGYREAISPADSAGGTTGAYNGIAWVRNKVMWPGVVEFSIDIKRTGPRPDQFTATMSLVTGLDPAMTQKCYVAANYAHPDGRLQKLGVNGDDLSLAEVEILFRGSNGPAPTYNNGRVWGGFQHDYWVLMHLGTQKVPYALSLTMDHLSAVNSIGRGYVVNPSASDNTSLGTAVEYTTQTDGDMRYYGMLGKVGDLTQYMQGEVMALDMRSFSCIVGYDYTKIDGTSTFRQDNQDTASVVFSYGQLVQSDLRFIDPAIVQYGRDKAMTYKCGYASTDATPRERMSITETNNQWFRQWSKAYAHNYWGLFAYGDIYSHPQGSISFILRNDYSFYDFSGNLVYPTATDGRGNIDRVEFKSNSKTTVTSHKAMFNKAFSQTRDYSYYTSTGPGTAGVFASNAFWLRTKVKYVENNNT